MAHAHPELRAGLLPLLADARRVKQQVERAGQLSQIDPSLAEIIVQSGLEDGDRSDDKIPVRKASFPASSLKPSQTSMVLAKSIGMALFMLKTGKVGGDLGALISSDNHIMDGHHRWSATILATGSAGTVGGYQAALPGAKLVQVLNLLTKGKFRVRNGKPGKGSLADYTAPKVRALLEQATVNGLPGKFPWSPEDVKSTLVAVFGSEEAGIEKMAGHADLVTKSVPSWAPARRDMPVIEPHQVPSAVKDMAQGKIDWADPHRAEF